MHGLRCYGNITRTRNVSEYILVLAVCLVSAVKPVNWQFLGHIAVLHTLMRPIVTDEVAWSVCQSVSLSVTVMSLAKNG